MAQLKPGSVTDMANSMAQMIEDAMNSEWQLAYPGDKLPDQGKLDREVLFAAILVKFFCKRRWMRPVSA